MNPYYDMKRYILEAFEQYESGLTTQGEAIAKVLHTATIATEVYLHNSEEVYFKETGKRPYELGL